ncbi:MAG: hypothetical protein H6807_03805 [Planctomycetes bacterium]|nr:hypothetical protein [Planctomycetota bacterium]
MNGKFVRLALVLVLTSTGLMAQTVLLSEDFSNTTFSNPPAGWSNVATALPGGGALSWDFSNQGMRFLDPPVSGRFAAIDPSWLSSSIATESILTSPPFNPSNGLAALTLEFDHQLRDDNSQAYVELRSGPAGSWQVVRSWVGTDVGWAPGFFGAVVHETIDLTPYFSPGKSMEIRFRGIFKDIYWWCLDNVLVSEIQPSDLAVEAILLPTPLADSCRPPQGNVAVGFQVKNLGTNTITSPFQASFSINGGAPVVESFQPVGGLPPAGSYAAIFSAPASFPAAGQVDLGVAIQLVGDVVPGNDALVRRYGGDGLTNLRGLPFAETFDSLPGTPGTLPPPGWVQDANDGGGTGADWIIQSGPTATAFTGPSRDHTFVGTPTGVYAHIDDPPGSEQAQINLLTPCLDLRTAIAPHLGFWSHSYNLNLPHTSFENELSVDVLAQAGDVLDVFGPYGHDPSLATWNGTAWRLHDVDLSAFVGQIVQLRFRGRTDNGAYGHDIAIDDILVADLMGPSNPGQPARPGVALFDLNDAVNAQGLGPRHGVTGPFSATVSPGGPFRLYYEGAPFQPIALLYGPLNPGSVVYPGTIGQFDIGGPGIDAQGLPLNIAAFIDAIAWANGGFQGFPYDAFYFTDPSGVLLDARTLPNFALPSGLVLTTFQPAIASPTGVKIANAVTVVIL